MLRDSLSKMYNRLRLLHYRELFGRIREHAGSLSATEAFALDVVYLLGNPTVTQLADELGVSQPNATYKVNSLASKGYINKTVSDVDKRMCRLSVSDRFFKYYDDRGEFIDKVINSLSSKFTPEQLSTFEKILDTIADIQNNSEAE